MPTPNPLVAAIARVAMNAMTETSKRSDNKMSAKAVADAKPDIVEAVTKAVAAAPEVKFVTNTEPWYTKRTRWAAIIGPASMMIGIGLKLAGVDYSFGAAQQGLLADALTAFGSLVAGWFAYQAGVATKPLGA